MAVNPSSSKAPCQEEYKRTRTSFMAPTEYGPSIKAIKHMLTDSMELAREVLPAIHDFDAAVREVAAPFAVAVAPPSVAEEDIVPFATHLRWMRPPRWKCRFSRRCSTTSARGRMRAPRAGARHPSISCADFSSRTDRAGSMTSEGDPQAESLPLWRMETGSDRRIRDPPLPPSGAAATEARDRGHAALARTPPVGRRSREAFSTEALRGDHREGTRGGAVGRRGICRLGIRRRFPARRGDGG